MAFETPGESFPGSAFYYLDSDTTNPLPLSKAVQNSGDDTADLAGSAARPFHLAGTALDGARAQQCLAMAIYYEAASESDAGQRAVAQVVLNRVAHPAYPNSVCGVVFQGSERETGCQFSFTCDGSMARKPARLWWDRAEKIAAQALAGSVYRPIGLATHYHTLQVHPYWAASLDPAAAIGMHQFYRWRGVAGMKASFTQVYHGHEPLPGVRAAASSAPAPDPVELAREFNAGIMAATGNQAPPSASRPSASGQTAPAPQRVAAPVYSDAIRQRGGDALFVGNLPPKSQINPQYANSGQWIAKP
ncbi:cell wall hydrolase [Altererythrobacter indicus]|uniref:Cell wall hydrolase n=2 Tax=Altericroceibacterium indicum TaxID=374177 RepID=A0A845AA62_9SPHN|nr:cell wall hydrolase [Altericroceibacterium indicum]